MLQFSCHPSCVKGQKTPSKQRLPRRPTMNTQNDCFFRAAGSLVFCWLTACTSVMHPQNTQPNTISVEEEEHRACVSIQERFSKAGWDDYTMSPSPRAGGLWQRGCDSRIERGLAAWVSLISWAVPEGAAYGCYGWACQGLLAQPASTRQRHSCWPLSTGVWRMLLKNCAEMYIKHTVQLTGVSAQHQLNSCCIFNVFIAHCTVYLC